MKKHCIRYEDLSPWLKAGMIISWVIGALWILLFLAAFFGVY